MTDPVENIVWLDASELQANDYNPNAVFTPELRLLERSILKTGWVQPVLVTEEGIIIDGFHRCMLARDSAQIRERWKGKVPCAVLDISRADAMLLTVRINRAKGTHIAVRMSDMVKELIDVHKYDPQEIAAEIGASKQEVDLLYKDGVFAARNMKDYHYSKAWYPEEKRSK